MTADWFGEDLPSPQREFGWQLLRFAGSESAGARAEVLFDERTDAARAALLADSAAGRMSGTLNVQLLGLLAWCRGLHSGDPQELRFAATWLEVTSRCAPALLPEPLRSAGREQFTADGLAGLAGDHEQALRWAAEFIRGGLGWTAGDQELQAVVAHAQARSLARAQQRNTPAVIELASRAVSLLPEGHWLRPFAQVQAASGLGTAAVEAGRMSCEPAVRLLEQAVAALPAGHPFESQFLTVLQIHLTARLMDRNPLSAPPAADALRAVEVGRRALAVLVDDDPDRALLLNTHPAAVFNLLCTDPTDNGLCAELLRYGRLNAEQHRGSDRDEAAAWSELAIKLEYLVLRNDDESLLGQLITVAADAYRLAPHGSAARARAGQLLGAAQLLRARRQGALAALDEPAEVFRAVITGSGLPDATDSPSDAVERAEALLKARAGLKELLETRYQLTGDRNARLEALLMASPPTPVPTAAGADPLADRMNRWSLAMSAFQEANSTHAITYAQAADDQRPDMMRRAAEEYLARIEEIARTSDDPVVREVAEDLRGRAEQSRAWADAVEKGEQRSVEDIMESVGLADWYAQGGTRTDIPPHLLGHLGGARLEMIAQAAALRAVNSSGEERAAAWAIALDTSDRLTRQPGVSPLTLVHHVRHLAWAAEQLDDWPAIAPVLAAAVRAAGGLVSARLDSTDRERLTAQYTAGLADASCAAALLAGETPEQALTLWESARGLLSAVRLDAMTDLGSLRREFPDAASGFEAARAALDSTQDSAQDSEQDRPGQPGRSERRHRAAAAWESELAAVRTLPGFEDFLTPPTGDQLRQLADRGPLVAVTLHQRRSHAVLVTPQGIDAVPLPAATLEQTQQWLRRLVEALTALGRREMDRDRATDEVRELLTELWQTHAEPVLRALGHHGPPASPADRPRLWWVPSGAAAFLPLHAAGRFTGAQPASGDSVLDRVVSSYSPTLRSLRHARWRPTPPAPPSVLAVAAPGAPGQARYLPLAVEEAEDIRDEVRAGRTLISEQANRSTLVAAMAEHPWLHFAGHAHAPLQSPRPTLEGGLVLGDGTLLSPATVDRLSLPAAELAYLSGCGTALGAPALADESLHMAGALHLAGYRDVIGTLWPVRDDEAGRIAVAFYRELLAVTEHSPAHALDAAVRAARARTPDRPDLWASYQHIGP
ncbi:CHAT domain-containing protein [Kitasatospora kifunensis]|uniref:CHAT domain-containing protein n=1 Tax=Kitasatospora kifunensis TaxID=58351 RepID=A0A7W7QWE5_KITKI|nr:CHAT domain-containing protein [Kitasatospora kifunensis]MBB4921018.1 hypothetical protein [Kitasatospora kifunensis]